MPFNFFKNLVGVKTDQAVDSAMEAIVRWDPKAASEAELRSMEEKLDELGRNVADAQAAFDKEKREADQIKAVFNQRLAAAEILQSQHDAESDAGRKASLAKSLGDLLTLIEGMHADVERETQDADDAKAFLDAIQANYLTAGQKLRTARSDLERAQRDMQRAEQQKDLSEQRAQAAREAAGLVSATSGISVALKAMQDTAAKAKRDAEAANAKARLLAPTNPEKEDGNIAAALASAQGKAAPAISLADRLAALKGGSGSGGAVPALPPPDAK